jgi:hypothetical protein
METNWHLDGNLIVHISYIKKQDKIFVSLMDNLISLFCNVGV